MIIKKKKKKTKPFWLFLPKILNVFQSFIFRKDIFLSESKGLLTINMIFRHSAATDGTVTQKQTEVNPHK